MGTNSRLKNSVINLAAGMGSQGINILLKFISRTVLIAYLGKIYLGINGLFSDILTMLSLTELGLDTAMQVKLYKPLAEGNIERVQLLMKFYKIAYRIVGLTIVGLGFLLIPFLPKLINDYDILESLGINLVLIFLLHLANSAFSYLFFASRSAIIKADQKEYITSITNMFASVISSTAQIISLVLFQNFIVYVAIGITAAILQNCITAVIATKKYPAVFKRTKNNISRQEFKDILKDLGALFTAKVNSVVLKATDNLVLSTFIGLGEVGLYSNYLLFYTTIQSLLSKIYNASKASAGNLFATESIEKQYNFFKSMNFLCIILYGTACVGIVTVANEFILCWIGEDYLIPQPFPIIVGIEILFVGIKQNLTQIRNLTSLFRQMWYRPIIGVIVNLTVSIVLVQHIGIYGVIIGTIVADISSNFMIDPRIIYKYVFQSCGKASDYYVRNLTYFVTLAGICGVDMLVCKYILSGYGWFSVILHIFICAVSVPSVFMLLYRNSDEGKYFMHLLAGIKKKAKP